MAVPATKNPFRFFLYSLFFHYGHKRLLHVNCSHFIL